MRPIAPRIPGADEHTVAEDQHEYKTLTVAVVAYQNGERVRVCRYTLSNDERDRIAKGEDIYFGTPAGLPLTPHWLAVGFDE